MTRQSVVCGCQQRFHLGSRASAHQAHPRSKSVTVLSPGRLSRLCLLGARLKYEAMSPPGEKAGLLLAPRQVLPKPRVLLSQPPA